MEEILSGRYAKALVDLAIQGGIVDEVAGDIRTMAHLLQKNPAFRKFLSSPLIEGVAKLKPVEKMMAGATDLGRNFILLLVQNGRIAILDEIVYDYGRMADDELGRAIACLETAGPINDKKVADIKRQLERLTKKKIQINVVINKALLAGARARVGDRIYDGSLLAKLEDMREVLTE